MNGVRLRFPAQVAEEISFHLRGRFAVKPSARGVVVMGAGIEHAVLHVIVREIGILSLSVIEGEEQHLHAGKCKAVHHRIHIGRDNAEVLRDNGGAGEPRGQDAEKILRRRLNPRALDGVLSVRRNLPVADKPAKMVDADHVKQGQVVGHPAHPPLIAVALQHLPPVQGISPALTGLAEIIGGNTRHRGGPLFPVELEHVGKLPHIGAVIIDIDGHVTEERYPPPVAIALQVGPLGEEQVLQECFVADLISELLRRLLHGGGIPVTQVDRPFAPHPASEMRLEGDEKSEVLKPLLMSLAELFIAFVAGRVEARVGPAEEPVFIGDHCVIVHAVPGEFGKRLKGVAGQQAHFHHAIRADEIHIAGKGGGAVVGGAAKGGIDGVQRENLPVPLPRAGQEIGKIIGGMSQISDAVSRGQRGYRQQYPTSPLFHLFSFWVATLISCSGICIMAYNNLISLKSKCY